MKLETAKAIACYPAFRQMVLDLFGGTSPSIYRVEDFARKAETMDLKVSDYSVAHVRLYHKSDRRIRPVMIGVSSQGLRCFEYADFTFSCAGYLIQVAGAGEYVVERHSEGTEV